MTYRFFYQKLFKIVQEYVSQIKTQCPDDTSMIKGIHLVRGQKEKPEADTLFKRFWRFSFVADDEDDEDGAFIDGWCVCPSRLFGNFWFALLYGAIAAVDWNYFSRPSSRRVKFLKNTLLLIDSCTDPSAPSSWSQIHCGMKSNEIKFPVGL